MRTTQWMVTTVCALIVAALSTALAAQTTAAATPTSAAAAPPSQAAAPSAGGPQEGIKVHGHWVIEVRNPDGSLVERRELQNGLSVAGGPLLAGLLTRGLSAGYWTVAFLGAPNPCAVTPTNACRIQQSRPASEPGYLPPGPGVSDTLTVSLGGANNSVVLQGTVTAPATGVIDMVMTTLGGCVPGTAPANCTSFNMPNVPPFNAVGSTEFSRRLFSLPPTVPTVNVVSGQIIQVTVTITFS